MKHCDRCGIDYPDNFDFCGRCGGGLRIITGRVCPRCGKVLLDPNSLFCPYCGAAINNPGFINVPTSKDNSSVDIEKKPSKNWAFYVFQILAIIVFAIFFLIPILKFSDDSGADYLKGIEVLKAIFGMLPTHSDPSPLSALYQIKEFTDTIETVSIMFLIAAVADALDVLFIFFGSLIAKKKGYSVGGKPIVFFSIISSLMILESLIIIVIRAKALGVSVNYVNLSVLLGITVVFHLISYVFRGTMPKRPKKINNPGGLGSQESQKQHIEEERAKYQVENSIKKGQKNKKKRRAAFVIILLLTIVVVVVVLFFIFKK